MCYRPIKIKNPRKFLRPYIDKEYIYVRCNHCEECRQEAINDWYVRLAYEADYYKSIGGTVYFVTFTFNDKQVPRFDFTPYQSVFEKHNLCYDIVKKKCFDFTQFNGKMCFDKLQVLSFLKHLRQVLREDYHITNMKYFIVTELGTDDKHTHRPHYHALLFLPLRFKNSNKFLGICNYCWSDRIKIKDYPHLAVSERDLHEQFIRGYYYQNNNVIVRPKNGCAKVTYHLRRGFCSWSKDPVSHKFRPELLNNLGIKYLLKYLYKDDLFMSDLFARDVQEQLHNLPSIKELEEYRELLPYNEQCDIDIIIDGIRYLKNSLPFHLQSTKLGESLLKEYGNIFNYSDMLHNRKIKVTSDKDLYFIPQYVLRRLMYDNDYDYDALQMGSSPQSVQLSERGYRVLKEQYNIRLEQKIENYAKYLSDKFVSRFYSLPHKTTSFVDVSRLRELLAKNSEILPVFDIVLRGVPCKVSGLDEITQTQCLRIAQRIYNLKIDTYGLKEVDFNKCTEVEAFPTAQSYGILTYFEKLPCLAECEEFLTGIDYIKKSVLSAYYDTKGNEYKEKVLTKKVNTSILYN